MQLGQTAWAQSHGATALTLSDADMALIDTLDRGHRLTSPQGIAPQWD